MSKWILTHIPQVILLILIFIDFVIYNDDLNQIDAVNKKENQYTNILLISLGRSVVILLLLYWGGFFLDN